MRLISIIIISKNRPETLRATVAVLRGHVEQVDAGAPVEIVVAEECAVPAPIPGVSYLHLPPYNFGFGHARARALRAAAGDIIVFVDDDIRPPAGWLPALLAPFAESAILAVGGGIAADPRSLGRTGAALTLLGFPAGGPLRMLAAAGGTVESRAISTCNCAFRRPDGQAAAEFDANFAVGGEDSAFFDTLATRGRTVFAAGAWAFHRQREGRGETFRWARRRGKACFCLDARQHGFLYCLVGPWRRAFALKLAVLTLLVATAWCRLGPLAAAAAAALATLAWSVVVSRRRRLAPGALTALDPELRELDEKLAATKTWLELPLAKFLVDAGDMLGRLEMAWICLRNRFARPPLIIRLPPLRRDAEDTPGTMPPAAIREMCHGLRLAGRRLVPVKELLARRRQAPLTLYFLPNAALLCDADPAVWRLLLQQALGEDVPVSFAAELGEELEQALLLFPVQPASCRL